MAKREFRVGFKPELRAEGGDSLPAITGYAAVFDSVTDLGFTKEVIKPGAFKRAIKQKADVRALVEHNPAMIIGRTPASLMLKEDDRGLYVEIQPPDTQVGRDVVTNLRNGNLDKMSFGFYIRGEEMKKDGGKWLREITDVDLFDVSVVAFPAYESTSAQARSAMFPDGIPENVESATAPAKTEDGNPELEKAYERLKADRDVKVGELAVALTRIAELEKQDVLRASEIERQKAQIADMQAAAEAFDKAEGERMARTRADLESVSGVINSAVRDLSRRMAVRK